MLLEVVHVLRLVFRLIDASTGIVRVGREEQLA
jgi:hypothetical protein